MHAISYSKDGKAEVMVSGEPAWHGLGAHVQEAQKWGEAYRLAGLDWEVEKRPLYGRETIPGDPGIKFSQVPAWGIFRPDTGRFFGAAGEDYTPIQNRGVFRCVDSIIAADDGAHYVSAGALFGGEIVWTLANLPEEIRIKGTDDISKPYLLFANYHRPGKAAFAKLCTTRVVCWNTFSAALVEAGSIFKIPHVPGLDAKIGKAREALFGIREQIRDMDRVMNTLAATPVSGKIIREALIEIMPTVTESAQAQNKARDILALMEDNDGDAFPSERGTAYALFNSFTRFSDHVAHFHKGPGEDEAQARKRAALFGAGQSFKFAALQGLVNVLSRNSLASFDNNLITRLF